MNVSNFDFKQIKFLTIGLVIAMAAFAYTFMIALLFAEELHEINYQFNSGVSATLLAWFSIYFVYRIDLVLNRIIKITSSFVFVLNFLISFVICAAFTFFTSWLLNIFIRKKYTLDISFFKEQMLIINFLLILLLTYHTVAYFTRAVRKQNKMLKSDNEELNKELHKYIAKIPSLSNKKTSLISIEEVMFFKIEDGVIFAHLKDGQKRSIQITTLGKLESILNPAVFFRINRSELVHIDKIKSFEPYFKDRLAIKLVDDMTTLHTSNAKSSSFRKWIVGAL